MIRTLLLKLLIKWYLKENRAINKIDPQKEMNLYRFKNSEQTIELIRSLMTKQTLWYYEAKTDDERATVKGALLILKIMKDANIITEKIHAEEKNPDKRLRLWMKYRSIHKTS